MPELPKTTDPDAWMRYFAMVSNNRAWELAAQPARSDAETREMLNAAHASAHHWAQVGTELNRARATYLVAEVHALAGLGASSLRLAEQALGYFGDVDCGDWERAYVQVIHAHAAAVAGNQALHAAAYADALAAVDAIADAEDRRIVEETFVQVPKPGSGSSP